MAVSDDHERVFLCSFQAQTRGIKFYDVATDSINVRDSIELRLEPWNAWDEKCVAVWLCSCPRKKLGNLARESAHMLEPLMKLGLVASG